MNEWLLLLAGTTGSAGAWLLYLASPQQQWRSVRPKVTQCVWGGFTLLIVALAVLLNMMGSMAAIASWMVLIMLVWTLAPFVAVWRKHKS